MEVGGDVRIKQIIGAILMAILTISLIILSIVLPIVININSSGIKNSMINSGYLDKTEQAAKTELSNYVSDEKVNIILENVSVKADISKIAVAFDNNTVQEVSNEVKEVLKQEVINILEDDIDSTTKNSFANVVSDAYIKSIFPVTEFNLLSVMYSKYSTKLIFASVVMGIICIVIYTYLAFGKKTYKWAIIALYNAIIINIIILVSFNMLNGIVIGNNRTTAVIMDMLSNIKNCIILEIIVIGIIAIISNYFAYFKNRKHKS